MPKVLEYVELDVPRCSLLFGNSGSNWNWALASPNVQGSGNVAIVAAGVSTVFRNMIGAAHRTSGKHHFEITVVDITADISIGFANDSFPIPSEDTATRLGFDQGAAVITNGTIMLEGDDSGFDSLAIANGDVIVVEIDLDNDLAWFAETAGNWNNNGGANPATGVGGLDISSLRGGNRRRPIYPAVSINSPGSDHVVLNCDTTTFARTPSSGFTAWADATCGAAMEFAAAEDDDPVGIIFDGIDNVLLRGGGLTGAADGKQFTLSMWIKHDGRSQNEWLFSWSSGGALESRMVLLANRTFETTAQNSANTQILRTSSNTIIPSNTWTHIICSFDMNNAASRHVYIQGAEDLGTVGTYTNDTIDFTETNWSVGGSTSPGDYLAGQIAEVWFHTTYIDLSVEANRRKFYANGKPVNLGADGSQPTGSAPLVYLRGPLANIADNLGTGGSFTVTGAPYDMPTSPKAAYFADDTVERQGGLTGAADSKLCTMSVWLKPDTGGATFQSIISGITTLNGGDFKSRIEIDDTGEYEIFLLNAAGADICHLRTRAVIPEGQWSHIIWSVDLNDTAKRHLYVNGLPDMSVLLYTNDTIDFTLGDWGVGAWPDNGNRYNGSMTELWFMPGTYIDLSIAANREKFRSSDGRPVWLGAQGTIPTGTRPLVYLGTVGRPFENNNAGSGGGFTLDGTLEETDMATGDQPCFNSLGTCQDKDAFTDDPQTVRHALDTASRPIEPDVLPNLISADFVPSRVSLGENLGERGTLRASFKDHPHNDTGVLWDRYLDPVDDDIRGYDTGGAYERGTYWGKFRARNPFLRQRPARWITGTTDDQYPNMEVRHFTIENANGPSVDGVYTIEAKDYLKFLDRDRSQAPVANSGFLSEAITATSGGFVLLPADVGDDDYPLVGYLNLGGDEIVQFVRFDYNDSFTKSLLHFDGNFTDTNAGGASHTWTTFGGIAANGTAKFGTFAATFDGVDDRISAPDSTDWDLGSAPFTIEVQFNCTAAGGFLRGLAGQTDAGPNNANTAFRIERSSGNFIQFHVLGPGGSPFATVSSSPTTFTNAVNTGYHHLACTRDGDILRMFIDGVQVGGDVAFTGSVNDVAQVLGLGTRGSVTTNLWIGELDEWRFSPGICRYTEDFDPPTAAFSNTQTSSGDRVMLTQRGSLGTEAVEHDAQDVVQVVLYYQGQDPADIIYDLMTNYSNVDPDLIDLTAWQTETATYLGTAYTGVVANPTGVADLVSELVEQAALSIWHDELQHAIILRVIHGIASTATLFDETNMLQGSFGVEEQLDKRISQAWTYFGRINHLTDLGEFRNFRSIAVAVDLSSETDYGQPAIKKITSRWIAENGRTVADRLNDVLIARFKTPPRKFMFTVMRHFGQLPTLGGGYILSHPHLQTADGARELVPIQITSLKPSSDRVSVEAQEMSFDTPADDLADRTITIDVDTFDFNFRSAHDLLYPEPVSGDEVTCIVEATVGSTSTAVPAFDVGNWPAGVTLNVIVLGRIQGKGGVGGYGASAIFASSTPGTVGQMGGTALYTRYPINLTSTTGDIWGGGGGGGGGGAYSDGSSLAIGGDGGGGGAGTNGGLGGAGGYGAGDGSGNGSGATGATGIATAGGSGNTGGGINGGNGGGPGLAGATGSNQNVQNGRAGGAAGNGIDGNSFTTDIGAPGDIRGPQIN